MVGSACHTEGCRPPQRADLIVVVVQVRVCTLELHHLDLGHPLFLLLGHQITVGVSAATVSSSPATVPAGNSTVIPRSVFTQLLQAHFLTLPHPPLLCIRWVSIRRCWGWRWVVLCLMGGVWLGGPCGGMGPIRWPWGGGGPPKKGRKPPPPGNMGGAGPPRGKPATWENGNSEGWVWEKS